MTDKIKALHYPDFFVDQKTLIKEILLFDELHFMDRPSITFGVGSGHYGTIGADSPLRQFEQSFRDNGIPVFVHKPQYGDEWFGNVKADISDPAFLHAVKEGLTGPQTFRDQMIAPGNYGKFGTEKDVIASLSSVDLTDVERRGGAVAILEDAAIKPMELGSDMGRAKQLIITAAICSAKINFALDVGSREGFAPLADATPYSELIGTKYRRATRALGGPQKVRISDLSFAVLDELLSKERLQSLTMKEAVQYRKASEDERRAFMEHISLLEKKYGSVTKDSDHGAAVSHIIETEIRPAVREYRNALKKLDEKLVGGLVTGAVGAMGGSSIIQVFGDLSLQNLLALAGAASAYVFKEAMEGFLARQATDRECSLSYLLSLE